MVRSVNRAIAGPDAAAGHGTVSAVAGAAAGDGREPGPGGPAARVPLRELMDDRLLDALLERSKDEAGGLRLTGEGSMLGELVKAVLERAMAASSAAIFSASAWWGGRRHAQCGVPNHGHVP
jgi:hypothetical protein